MIAAATGWLSADLPPDEARSRLRRELLNPEYQQRDLWGRFVRWLERQLDRALVAADQVPPISTLVAMVLGLGLVLAVVWLLSRVRDTLAAPRSTTPVLTGERLSAGELRARALAAQHQGRHGEAVIEAFRALAVRQVQRGRIADAPGATAHELADTLGRAFHPSRPRIEEAARLFDLVCYGKRPATATQAQAVLDLDDELGRLR